MNISNKYYKIMKRIIYFSITMVSLFFGAILFYTIQSNIKHETDDRMRIIVNLDTAIISGNILTTQTSNIKQKNIRELFKQFNVQKIQAVYRNRYNKIGKIKPGINTESTDIWQQIIMSDNRKAAELITLLKNEKGVLNAYIERPLPFKPCVAPNDAQYLSQWHLNSTSCPNADIRAEQAWNINKGRNDVIIAVCDGGVDYTHHDLDPGDRSRVIAGYDSGNDDNDPMDDLPDGPEGSFGGHGTHVAGIIGAITNNGSLNNGKNVAGVMWNCKIMPVKMVGNGSLTISYPFGSTNWDFSTTAFPSDVADAIDYAVNNGAHVINLSYGFDSMGGLLNDIILRVPLLYQAILNAYNHNVVVVAAMGNEYNQGNPIEFPAFFRIVIAVGATTNSNPPSRWSNSNTGSHICVSAPGEGIMSTIRGDSTGSMTGTSMAAPIVSGVAGLIISQGLDRNFNLTNDDVRHIIERTADDIISTGIGFDNETGYGKVNAYRALSLLNIPNVLYHGVSIGGTSIKLSTLSKWIYYGPQWGLASGMYYNVDQYQITKHITFDVPFCSVPQVWMRDRESTCLGFGNPNDGYPYAIITNITNSGFDVKYATYYVRYNSAGQTFNKWIPVEPSITTIAYTAVGEPNYAALCTISGPTLICTSATYTVNNLPSGYNINWSSSSNIKLQSSSGNSATFSSLISSQQGYIQATIVGSTGSFTVPQYTVWLGPPVINSVSGPNYSIVGSSCTYSATISDVHESITSFNWSIIPNLNNYFNPGSNNCYITWYTASSYALSVNASNTCGTGSSYWYPVNVGSKSYLSISPNPATDNVQVSIIKPQNTLSASDTTSITPKLVTTIGQDLVTTYSIKIYNTFGTLFYSTRKSGDTFTIPVNNLKNGTFIIEANDGKQSFSQQLIIEH